MSAVGSRGRWSLLLLLLLGGPGLALEVKCFDDAATVTYCSCMELFRRSGLEVDVRCDFQQKEAAELTENIYPFARARAVMASVRVANATGVKVTGGFLRAVQAAPSVALDLLDSGEVLLAPSPPLPPPPTPTFSTYTGVGLEGCVVPEVPPRLLRDRNAASLRLSRCRVGVVRSGLLHNVAQVRYVVVEASQVEAVDGPLSTGGQVQLSMGGGDLHQWYGITLTNASVGALAPGALNCSHQARRGAGSNKVEVRDSRLGSVDTGALVVTGDISVTIKGNFFQRVESEAFQVSVSGDVKFEMNVAGKASWRALQAIVCNNVTSLDRNTVHLDALPPLPSPSRTLIPFHPSCGAPQVFTVMSPVQTARQTVISAATWVLLVLLLLVVVAAILAAYRLTSRHFDGRSSRSDHADHNNFFHYFSGRPGHSDGRQELDMMKELTVEGVSNPLYDTTQPS